jgi:hypothetical protein
METLVNTAWLVYSVASDGRVRPHNPWGSKPPYYGDPGASSTVSDIVGMATDPDGSGYWLADRNGCRWYYRAKSSYGSMCGIPLNQPVVGIEEYKAPTGSASGYWMVASDGGIFSFGSAPFHGSMGGVQLNAPMVGMTRVPGGTGYWTVASDGGIFSFGGAPFYGSLGGQSLSAPIIGMDTYTSGGYILFGADGKVYTFGVVQYRGSHLGEQKAAGSARGSSGYWMVEPDGDLNACTYSNGCYDIDP